MGMKRRILAVCAGVAIIGGVAVTAAFGAHRADPGITASSIKIGGTFPMTGPASLYKTIALAEKAYFDYVNAHGGGNRRKNRLQGPRGPARPAKTAAPPHEALRP